MMQIGIDDEEELKEATKRAYWKGANLKISFEDGEDENVMELKNKKLDKTGKVKKFLHSHNFFRN
jgi:hypothetical protein